jgi:hypothetical protein
VIKQTQGNGATQYENNISVNFQIYSAGLFVLFRFITVAERRYWHIRVIRGAAQEHRYGLLDSNRRSKHHKTPTHPDRENGKFRRGHLTSLSCSKFSYHPAVLNIYMLITQVLRLRRV